MFAIIEHLKQLHGGPAEELEKNLLKVRSQADRKMTIVEFATARKPAAPLADRSNRPSTAPAPTKPAAPASAASLATAIGTGVRPSTFHGSPAPSTLVCRLARPA